MFKLRKSLAQVDQAVAGLRAALADDLVRHVRAEGAVFLYAEASVTSIDLVQLMQHSDGALSRVHPAKLLLVHVREIWTQFRIARLPAWSALGFTMTSDGKVDITYVYPENIDASLTAEQRATRWLARAAGAGAIAAIRSFDPDLDDDFRDFSFPPLGSRERARGWVRSAT